MLYKIIFSDKLGFILETGLSLILPVVDITKIRPVIISWPSRFNNLAKLTLSLSEIKHYKQKPNGTEPIGCFRLSFLLLVRLFLLL